MKNITTNTLNQGMNMDYHSYNTPNTVYTEAINARLVNYGGDEFIMQPEMGNTNICNLKEGYIALGYGTYNGITYILSTNPNTGYSEIGSIPSPNYYSNELVIEQIAGTGTTDIAINLTNANDVYILTIEPIVSNSQVSIVKYAEIPTLLTYTLFNDSISNTVTIEDWSLNPNHFEERDWPIDDFKGYRIQVLGSVKVTIHKVIANSIGKLNECYGALQNWGRVNESYPINGHDFNTYNLNFFLTNPIKTEIQPSYDGTVNIIFTDNINPPRIVNSRFSQLEGNRFEIIDRTGTNDENVYTDDNFETLTSLFIKSRRILDLTYIGQQLGGRLMPGVYRYYFRYVTADGNLTDVIEESGNVYVYHGTKVNDIRGGIDEATNKLVRFGLQRLDTVFSYIKVYYVYKAGNSSSINTAYEIDKLYPITDSIEHNGYEAIKAYDIQQLSVTTNSIARFKTMAQMNNRLFIANITERLYDRELFRQWAEELRLGHKVVPMYSDGQGWYLNFNSNLNYLSNFINEDYGYRSDINLYNKLGYWGAESYAFGVVFILNDGSLTDVFPLTGIDDRYINQLYSNNPTYIDGWDLSDDPNINNHYGQNIKGVYRFPKRDNLVGDRLYNEGLLQVLAATVLHSNTALYNDVKSKAQGLFFVRADRVRDCIIQGYTIPTYSFATKEFGEYDRDFYSNNEQGEVNWRYLRELFGISNAVLTALPPDDNQYWANSNLLRKAIPLVRGIIESTSSWSFIANNEVYTPSQFAINQNLRDVYRYGLMSGDIDTNQSAYTYLNNNTVYIDSVLDVYGVSVQSYDTLEIETQNDLLLAGTIPTIFYTKSVSNSPDPFESFVNTTPTVCRYVFGGTEAINDTFSSSIPYGRLEYYGSPTDRVASNLANVNIGTYIGLKIDSGDPASYVASTLTPTNLHQTIYSNRDGICITKYVNHISSYDNVRIAQLVNLYNQPGPIATSFIKERYRTENLSYYPITKRMEFSEYESLLDNSKLTLFGGDCFLATSYKKVLYGGDNEALIDPERGKTDDIGYGLLMVHEHNNNPYLRTELITSTENSTFYPLASKPDKQSFFRHSLEPETQLYNAGYSELSGDTVKVSPNFNLPYIANSYPTRVMYSQLYTANNFSNGYRSFEGFNFEDYPRHTGSITEMVNVNGTMILVQENGVAVLPISERIISGTNENVFLDSPLVLPEPSSLMFASEEYGSKWQFSIVKSNNALYGIDSDKGKAWRFTGKQIELISDFKVNRYLKPLLSELRSHKSIPTFMDIRGLFKDSTNEVIWSLYSYNSMLNPYGEWYGIDYEVPNVEGCITFNEALNLWTTVNSWIPYIGFSRSDKFYSFNSKEGYNKIWLHDQVPYYTFYGNEHTFEYEFITADNPYMHKLFTNIISSCNQYVPVEVIYSNDEDTVNQPLIYREDGNILRFNSKYKENHLYIVLPKIGNKFIRDKYMRVRFIYSGGKHHIIHSITTTYLTSAS